MNFDKVTLARSGYTVLDVLSDIGGIQSIFLSGIGIIIGILNYKNLDNYMASRLYKIQRPKGDDSSDIAELRLSRFMNIYEWLFDSIPNWIRCKCCRKTERLLEIELARERLTKEINII